MEVRPGCQLITAEDPKTGMIVTIELREDGVAMAPRWSRPPKTLLGQSKRKAQRRAAAEWNLRRKMQCA